MVAILIMGVLAFVAWVMSIGWAVQRRTDDGGWVDVFWTFGTGAAGVAVALWPQEGVLVLRQALVAGLVAVWSIRLGTHIALRVRRGPEDARYVRLREQWGERFQPMLFGFMQLQAPCSAILCLSIALAAGHPAEALRWQDIGGVLILVAAIAGEAIADAQLDRFKADPANRGKVNDNGLWAWSRHPNYFFEWLGWLAYPLIAIDLSRPWTLLSLAAPALMYVILTRLTGVPALEAHMAESRGKAWSAYAERVGAFFPFPPKRTSTRKATS